MQKIKSNKSKMKHRNNHKISQMKKNKSKPNSLKNTLVKNQLMEIVKFILKRIYCYVIAMKRKLDGI